VQVWEHLPDDREAFLKAEQAFFDEVTQTSGKLFPFPKDGRKAEAVKILKNIRLPRKVTLPNVAVTLLSRRQCAVSGQTWHTVPTPPPYLVLSATACGFQTKHVTGRAEPGTVDRAVQVL